jgi:hypothetical protein
LRIALFIQGKVLPYSSIRDTHEMGRITSADSRRFSPLFNQANGVGRNKIKGVDISVESHFQTDMPE